jgi:hypothetical protein
MTRRYVPQRKLVGMAMAAGFGRCTDIREVRRVARVGAKGSADYVTKQLAGYLTKQSAVALAAKTNERRRPLRTSRGWGDGIREARCGCWLMRGWRTQARNRDSGPFAFVQVLAGGDALVRVGSEWQRHQPPSVSPSQGVR